MYRVEHLERRTLFASYAAATVTELVAAVTRANASREADAIVLAAGATFTLSAPDNMTNGPTGLPVIAANGGGLTILGNGGTIERSAAAGTPAFRLFDVAAGAALTMNDLTLRGGLIQGGQWPDAPATAQGGAVFSRGNLTLERVVVRNNAARGLDGWSFWGPISPCAAEGGGVHSSGVLTVSNSTVVGNAAVGGRGHPSGIVLVDMPKRWGPGPGADGSGGGIFVAGGTATFRNSTVSANVAEGGAGGGDSKTRRAAAAVAGRGTGGGIYIGGGAVAGVDAFTVRNTSRNVASTSASNIFGSYTAIL